MTHSLNFRLLAAFALVIIVIIGSVFFFTYRTTRSEISQVGERMETDAGQKSGNRAVPLLSVSEGPGKASSPS